MRTGYDLLNTRNFLKGDLLQGCHGVCSSVSWVRLPSKIAIEVLY